MPSMASQTTDSGISDVLTAIAGFTNNVIVETVSFPHNTINSTTRQIQGSYKHYPNFLDADQCNLSLYEDDGYNMTQYLYTWQQKVVSNDGVYGLPGDYKKSVILEGYDAMNILLPTITLRLNGCWPTLIHPFDLNYTDGGFVTVGVSLSVDPPVIIESSLISTSVTTALGSLFNS